MVELFDSLSGRTRFAHFFAVFSCILYKRPEGASDVISGRIVRHVVVEKCAKFGHLARETALEKFRPKPSEFSTVFSL